MERIHKKELTNGTPRNTQITPTKNLPDDSSVLSFSKRAKFILQQTAPHRPWQRGQCCDHCLELPKLRRHTNSKSHLSTPDITQRKLPTCLQSTYGSNRLFVRALSAAPGISTPSPDYFPVWTGHEPSVHLLHPTAAQCPWIQQTTQRLGSADKG